MQVTVKTSLLKVYGSSKLKNPNESNTQALKLVKIEILKNENIKNVFNFYIDKGDEYFYTLEGLASSNEADVLVEKAFISKADLVIL